MNAIPAGATAPNEQPLLIVDGANVVGSRPDGWWRDRAGAAQRLYAALTRKAAELGEVVLVLEGAARRGVDAGTTRGVRVVHAPGLGDDTIVALVAAARRSAPAREVTMVSADRGLIDRVRAHGAQVLGPRTLWDQLERD